MLLARVPALPPGARLPPLDLTRRGKLTRIQIRAFTAGRVASHVGERMVDTAEARLRRALK